MTATESVLTKLLVIACMLALAACETAGSTSSGAKFWKPGATLADYQADAYACERDTRMAVPQGFTISVYGQLEAQGFFVQCMRVRGWAYA